MLIRCMTGQPRMSGSLTANMTMIITTFMTSSIRPVCQLTKCAASPYHESAKDSLNLYRVLEPDTWIRVVGRVQGANFGAIYGNTKALGARKFTLPPGHTWRSYVKFLLATLPESMRQNYVAKFKTSIRFWWKKRRRG